MALPDPYIKGVAVVSDEYGLTYEIALWWVLSGAPVGNIDQTYAANFAAAAATNIGPVWKTAMVTTCSFEGVQVTAHSGGQAYTGLSRSNAGIGTVAGFPLPINIAAVIRKYSTIPGRAGRGRWYVPCVPEVFTNKENQLSVVGSTAYQALASALTLGITIAGDVWNWGHHSRSLDLLAFGTGVVVNERVGQQERRRVRPLLG